MQVRWLPGGLQRTWLFVENVSPGFRETCQICSKTLILQHFLLDSLPHLAFVGKVSFSSSVSLSADEHGWTDARSIVEKVSFTPGMPSAE